MILGVALHKPKGPKEESLFLQSLQEYGDAQRKHEGHVLYAVGKDEHTGLLVVVSLWTGKQEMMAAQGDTQKQRGKFDFKANQEGPTRYWSGNVEFAEFG